jgi:CheY-like chemotaxis protein
MSVFPHILLVDDDHFWSETLAECLRRRGCIVHEARTALEGLELLKKECFSLVISDYRLPGMDGLHFLRVLRRHRNQVSVVMMSNEDEPNLPQRALAEGALAFLAKTSAPAQLLRKIRQLLASALVKELAPPSLHIWQRLLPNPHGNGHKEGKERSGNENGSRRKPRKATS